MASMSSSSSPFTQKVVSAMRKLYPEHLADKSFDNTGLLLEAPSQQGRKPQRNSVLLTIDLTTTVANEAIERRDSVIVAYHPIIFRGLKSLTLADSQQRSLLRLAAEGISVYCPHTAVDAAVGGNADWLGDIVTGTTTDSAQKAAASARPEAKPILPNYALHGFPSSHDASFDSVKLATLSHTRKPLQPSSSDPNAGIGRLLTLERPLALSTILETLTTYLGQPTAFKLAIPQTQTSVSSIQIRTIAICAGSGGSVLADAPEADLWLTGELVHHEALAAIERGTCVIAFSHSNSERAYLGAVLQGRLEEELRKEIGGGDVEVAVSKADRDPFSWVVRT